MNPLATAAGFLISIGPVALILGFWVHGPGLLKPNNVMGMFSVLATLGISTGGLALARRPWQGRLLCTVGVLALLVQTAPVWVAWPSVALPILLGAAAVLSHLWVFPGIGRISNRYLLVETLREAPVRRARAASVGALAVWALYMLGGGAHSPSWPLLICFGLSGWVAILVLREAGDEGRWRHRILWAVYLISGVVSVLGWSISLLAITVSASIPVAAALLLPLKVTAGLSGADWWDPIFEHPARMLVTTFFALCVVGTSILALPFVSAGQHGISLGDAAFTAVSAVCVTGLTVLDTPSAFSGAGQVVLLLLIQLGGLGIMTFSTAALRLLGRRISLRHEAAMAQLMTAQDKSRLFGSIRLLILFTFSAELAGAVLLALLFASHGDGAGTAIWRGLFTAISAFCNAGFALQSNNLIPYQHDALVLHTVALLIILGGLSPAAVFAVPALLRKRGRRIRPVTAQVRLIIIANVVLIALGSLWFGAVEWHNSLDQLGFFDKLHNAYFQAVALRTAGFNSVDLAKVQPASVSMMLVWMFIGGSPGGTAGGIKVTTVAVLILAVLATVRGRDFVLTFGRHIPHRTVFRAAAVTTVAGLGVLLALGLLQLTQTFSSERAIFEVVSALGTVGLSLGATMELDGIGRGVIMLCMFTGRVGTLTLFMLLGTVSKKEEWRRPSEDLEVG